MTFSSNPHRRHFWSIVIAGFFTVAGYTSLGCGSSYTVPAPQWPKEPKNAASVNITVEDFATGEPIEGARVTLIQGNIAKTLSTGIGGSAFFPEGFREGAAEIMVSASGYEAQKLGSALIAGYNKEEVILKRRSR